MGALAEIDPAAKPAVCAYLLALIDRDDRAHVERVVFGDKET